MTVRRILPARYKELIEAALELVAADGAQESREVLAVVKEADEVLVDLPEGSNWS
jgi:hypothetical protein